MGHLRCGALAFVYHGSRVLKHLQAHPEAKKWRDTPFPHYSEFRVLIEGKYATGESVYRVSLTSDDNVDNTTSTEDVEDIDNDIIVSQSTDAASQVCEDPCRFAVSSISSPSAPFDAGHNN